MLDVTPNLTNPSLLISTDPNFADITRNVALTRDGLFYRATFDRLATGEFFTFGGALPVISQVPVCANPPISGSTTSAASSTPTSRASASVPANQANTTINVGTGTELRRRWRSVTWCSSSRCRAPTSTRRTRQLRRRRRNRSWLLSAGRTAGNYEFAAVTAVVGSLVTVRGGGLNNGLINSYTKAAKRTTRGVSSYQVIRVPQYYNATITGTVNDSMGRRLGRIVALDVAGRLNFGTSLSRSRTWVSGG